MESIKKKIWIELKKNLKSNPRRANNLILVTKLFQSVQFHFLSQLIKSNKLVKQHDAARQRQRAVDWQAAWPSRTPAVGLGSSPGSHSFITSRPGYWLNLASPPVARLPLDATRGSELQSQGWRGRWPHLAFPLLDGDQLPHSWLTAGLSRCRVSPAGKSRLMKSQPTQRGGNGSWLILQELYQCYDKRFWGEKKLLFCKTVDIILSIHHLFTHLSSLTSTLSLSQFILDFFLCNLQHQETTQLQVVWWLTHISCFDY